MLHSGSTVMYELLQLIYVVAHKLTQLIQPVLVPICFVLAWATLGFGIWNIWAAARDSVRRAKKMHQIPCAHCEYFSGNYLLKCPIHPKEALSESAIGCRDFESTRFEWPLEEQKERVQSQL